MIKAIFYSFEKYLNALLLAIFGFIFASRISINEYGLYSYAEAITGILSIFSLSGLDQITQRELVKNTFKKNDILFTSLLIKILSLLVACLFMIFILPEIYENKSLLILVYILSTSIFLKGLLFLSSYLICDDKYKQYACIGVIASLISFVVKILILLLFDNIYYVAFCSILEPVILISCYINYIFINYNIKWSISKLLLRIYWEEGRYLIFSGAMILIYTRIDQVMIGQLLPSEDLANYSLALKVLTLYIIISTVFNLKFLPVLKKDSNIKYKIYKDMLILTFIFSVVLSVINLYLSPFIIQYFYQDKFESAIKYVEYLTPIISLTFLLSTTGRILVTENLSKIAFERNLCAFCLNIMLNFLLIKYIGVSGAIIASVISYLISSIVYLFFRKETRKIIRDIYNEF